MEYAMIKVKLDTMNDMKLDCLRAVTNEIKCKDQT